VPGSCKGGQASAKRIHERAGAIGRKALKVVARVVMAAVGPPMLPDDVRNGLPSAYQNVEPKQNGPKPVLFADMR
jgi:hypothetical protein